MSCCGAQETLRQRVCELEREARPREQRLADSEQHMTTAQDNLQVQLVYSSVYGYTTSL